MFTFFLATLVALHFTPVSKRVSLSFGLQPSSVAWSLFPLPFCHDGCVIAVCQSPALLTSITLVY